MNPKKLLVTVLSLCLLLSLCACDSAEEPPDALGTNTTTPSQGDQPAQPSQDATGTQTPGGGVDFNLQPAPDPDFDSPASGGSNDKIYTIQGDYAYEMDPNTLEIIGPPLDPITHEPVDNPVEGGGNPSTPNNPQDTPAASEPPASEPPASDPPATSTPTADTKLPNTGMFLEDD